MRETPIDPVASPKAVTFLGIEGGGSHLVALYADAAGSLLSRYASGPANLRLLSDPDLRERLETVRDQFPNPSAVGIAFAGLRTTSDADRVRTATETLWPGIPIWVGNDLECALAADGTAEENRTRVLVLSGTGSCCYGQDGSGRTAKVGGWGHWLGDRGSAFHLVHSALRDACLAPFDRSEAWGICGQRILRALQRNEPDALIAWIQSAEKSEIAALAPEVVAAASAGDRYARAVLKSCALELARDALACAARLGRARKPVEFIFAGGLLQNAPTYAAAVRHAILGERTPGQTRFVNLKRETTWGAVAKIRALKTPASRWETSSTRSTFTSSPSRLPPRLTVSIPTSAHLAPTECRNPRSLTLDQLPIEHAIDLMVSEEATVAAAVKTQRAAIAKLVRLVVKTFQNGGRLFYIGAGTSGRLGVLDASECPPTFRTSPDLIQGIIAGGHRALGSAVEGAEDDSDAGAAAVRFREMGRTDVVVGIAASGRTPFVWGALGEARRRGATTALICCHPQLRFAPRNRPEVVIALPTGPEVLTGSTRLKAGTATKLVLNLVTTLAMVRLGKVVSNLMIDLHPSNTKLRDRAVRIVQEITGCDPGIVLKTLEQQDWGVAAVIRILGRKGNH